MDADCPVFARDVATASYSDQRAAEYDEWYLGTGQFASRDRPGWDAEVDRLVELVSRLPPARTLDVACGSGFLTRHLRGLVVGVDQSRSMVALTQSRLSNGVAMVGDALDLPFADDSFDRVVTGHFYGHLPPEEREVFLAEARRVAGQLVVIDAAMRDEVDAEQWQERILNDGSRHHVFKRYFHAQQLATEVDGRVLHDGPWFVVAATTWPVDDLHMCPLVGGIRGVGQFGPVGHIGRERAAVGSRRLTPRLPSSLGSSVLLPKPCARLLDLDVIFRDN